MKANELIKKAQDKGYDIKIEDQDPLTGDKAFTFGLTSISDLETTYVYVWKDDYSVYVPNGENLDFAIVNDLINYVKSGRNKFDKDKYYVHILPGLNGYLNEKFEDEEHQIRTLFTGTSEQEPYIVTKFTKDSYIDLINTVDFKQFLLPAFDPDDSHFELVSG